MNGISTDILVHFCINRPLHQKSDFHMDGDWWCGIGCRAPAVHVGGINARQFTSKSLKMKMHLLCFRPSSYSRGCDPCSHGEKGPPDQTYAFSFRTDTTYCAKTVLPTACSTYAQPASARGSASPAAGGSTRGWRPRPTSSSSEQCDAASTLLHDETAFRASAHEAGAGWGCPALNYQLWYFQYYW